MAERGKTAAMLMEAHYAYKAGDIDTALTKYAMLAELGYEVAQSNVAHILDRGMKLNHYKLRKITKCIFQVVSQSFL